MTRLTGSLATYPARAAFFWYIGLIATGGALLTLPVSHVPGKPPISVLDAVFTATSACCVTGLVVRSTPHDFSLFGQAVILGLIQLGGIGIITVTTYVTLKFVGKESLRQRTAIAQTLGSGDYDLRWVIRNVFWFVVTFEGAGFLLLAVRNLFEGDVSYGQALWEAGFHSVSAFCNAGFALHDDSLARYAGDWWVNPTIMALIVFGGIGFPVVLDVRRHWGKPWRELWDELSVHSKMMLFGTAGLLTLGTFFILLLEWNQGLGPMPIHEKFLVAAFQSTTCRTAGFQTIDLVKFTDATLFLMVILMVIGAGPCSTAGGFKVSTLMVLLSHAWARFRGQHHAVWFRRSISPETVSRAIATSFLFGIVAVAAVVCLLVLERQSDKRFLASVFEVASALGTVGLSMNFTALLGSAGKVVVIVLMFIGRIGPISAFIALAKSERRPVIEFAKEEVLIG